MTDKQEKFVQELIKGKSQREAYKAAYDCVTMSDRVIDNKASLLLKKDEVRVRYDEIRSKLLAEAEREAIFDGKRALQEITSIANDDISNYLDFYPDENSPCGIKIAIKDSRIIDTKNISEISIGANGQFKFKLYGRDTALYKIADITKAGNANDIEDLTSLAELINYDTDDTMETVQQET